MTAMADAMIFVVIMGLAASALFAFGGDDISEDDASKISESIFSAKLRTSDILDTDDSGLIGLPDLTAFRIMTGEGDALQYIEDVLDSFFQRPGSYYLEIEYNGDSVAIGNPDGTEVCSCIKEFTVTYGGSIRTELRLY
jgi:hypothetical protein